MELREAMTQISEIRQQIARTEVFRGYRALPVAFSGGLALLAATIQSVAIRDPGEETWAYLGLWIGTAIVSALVALGEMTWRRDPPGAWLRREITWLAIEQFVPCLAAGSLLTIVLVRSAPASLWMLPGLWQILFSLGIFASCRLLPRATFGVALFYLVAGLACLTLSSRGWALNPWLMGIPFGAGQFFAAGILYRTLECHDELD